MEENQNMPKHIAIIMDGNGRWAKAELHFGVVLVNKQCSPGHHIFLLLDHDFGSHAMKIIGHYRIDVRLLHVKELLSGFSFQVDVQAFV